MADAISGAGGGCQPGGWRHAATIVGLDGPMNISIIA
jgi:hypothetical protein